MADFCQQCSIELYKRDRGDLKPCPDPECDFCKSVERDKYVVICEGCGFTRVDEKGRCLYHEANGGTASSCYKRTDNSNEELERLWDKQP
jgi:hypothetical protein